MAQRGRATQQPGRQTKQATSSLIAKNSKRFSLLYLLFCLFLLLYVPSQQLWSLRDGQLT